jgi:hypothetical protein
VVNDMHKRILSLLTTTAPVIALGAMVSCAPDYADAPTKLVGVGYNPDEIGPSPTPYGGVVEYSWVNFAGGGLSLALMGLGSFDEVGPDMVGYAPPYAAVYGFSYIFSTKLAAADSLGGVTSVPPEVDDTCYTTFEAGGPIGSFKTVDVGSWMEFRTLDDNHEGGLRFDRNPRNYPADKENVFVYYIGLDYWAAQASYSLYATPDTTNNPGSLASKVLRQRNFPAGEPVEFRFPGAVASSDAPIASIPRPSSAVGNTDYILPNLPGGVEMEWSGPRYDPWGNELDAGSDVKTCLSFAAPTLTTPEGAEDCTDADRPDSSDYLGQMYTGPWDTDDGKVTFHWTPGQSDDEFVSIAVRFLGPVDRTDPNYTERVVEVQPTDNAVSTWNSARRAGSIPNGMDCPTGRRSPTPCEEGGEWVFDDAYETADGQLAPAMRGDPFHNVAELTCRLKDDGEYTLTADQLDEAITYARRAGAQGAIFYFARSTEAEADVPPAKDQYNNRLVITPVKLTSRAIDIGRFWFEE